ncbi:hypothetical protein ACEQ8H_004051 [Pleosporales sp. CAS-2024a]
MADEKHGYQRPATPPPIPSYEEATSSRHAHPASDDAERQRLLRPDTHMQADQRRRHAYYQPPSVQSVDDDHDDDGDSDNDHDDSDNNHDHDLRQTMHEMEILDPEAVDDARARRNRSASRFSKRFYTITNSFPSLHLPRLRWPAHWRPDATWFTQRIPTIPDEYRPGWSVLARLCGLVLIVSLVYLLVVSEMGPMGRGFGSQFNPEWVRGTALSSIEGWRIEKNVEYITSYDHVGGTEGSYVLGQWIEAKFKDAHMDTFTHDEYWAYINYAKPHGRRVAIVHPPEKRWEAQLDEPFVFTPPKAQTRAYHAMSASGNATGPLIYVNYCDKNDFKRLWDSGIDVHGAVVLCRAHGTQPHLAVKVRAAQNAGCAGVLVYSDPADDGFKKGSAWPDGKWRPAESVQRGSVAQTNMVMGDVTTPGKPSVKKVERVSLDKSAALPKIPSLPLSWKDAQKLLQSLQGLGEKLPPEWVGGVPDVGDAWYSGHPDTAPKINLQNFNDEAPQQLVTNIFGAFRGLEDGTRKILVGNHRDSWCFGAADPGSGTAVMLEVVRVLGELRAQGWRPLRTIEFASWDAGEYNKIGSTEHVEANADALRSTAIAYLNVDVGVTGDQIWAQGSPIFQHVWGRVMDRLTDPQENKTLKELWDTKRSAIANPAASSDAAPFQFISGTSSIDFGFSSTSSRSPNPLSGSCYETYSWMAKYMDPGWSYHSLLAQALILLILEIAHEPIMPLKIDHYARHLQAEGQALLDWTATVASGGDYDISIFQPLVDALGGLKIKADEFHKWESSWYNQVYATGGFETQSVTMQRVGHNAKLAAFESALIDLGSGKDGDEGGLPDRKQFKHVIFAPTKDNALETSVFPFIRDAIEKRDWDAAAMAIKKTSDVLNRAGDALL